MSIHQVYLLPWSVLAQTDSLFTVPQSMNYYKQVQQEGAAANAVLAGIKSGAQRLQCIATQ